MNVFRKIAAAGLLTLMPVAGMAAPINLADFGYQASTTTAPIEVNSVAVTITLGLSNVLSAFDLGNIGSMTSFDVTDKAQYTIALQDLLGGQLTASGATELNFTAPSLLDPIGTIDLLFEGVAGTGSYAPWNGEAIYVKLDDFGLNAPNPHTGFLTGKLTVQLLEDIPSAAIPLPAGGLLLLTANGALLIRRKRTT